MPLNQVGLHSNGEQGPYGNMKKSSACAGGALLGSYTEGHTIAFLSLASLTGLSHFYLYSKGCAQESKDNRFFLEMLDKLVTAN